eukprot:542016-Pyramimonas_sp.AAC.2
MAERYDPAAQDWRVAKQVRRESRAVDLAKGIVHEYDFDEEYAKFVQKTEKEKAEAIQRQNEKELRLKEEAALEAAQASAAGWALWTGDSDGTKALAQRLMGEAVTCVSFHMLLH